MTTKEHLIDPAILAKTENYYLLARTVVEGFIAGLHRSLYHGFGSEFVHYRNYYPGDDLKYIDWKVYARLNKFQSKVFQEETNTNCYLVLDNSASMEYSGTNSTISKSRYAKILAACLAYLSNRQGDNVGLYAYDERLSLALKPSHRRSQVHTICNQLLALKPHGEARHSMILRQLTGMLQRRGIIVFIGDFLDAGDELHKAIKYFRVTHHDCIIFHVLHDDEITFPFMDTMRFVDSENGSEIITAADVVRERYLTSMRTYLERFTEFCHHNNIDYHQATTSQGLANLLASYLHRRVSLV